MEAPARTAPWFDHARRGLVISAVAVAVQFPADLSYEGGVRTAAVRLAWAGLLLGLVPLVSARRPRLSVAAMHVAAVATAVAATVIIARSGGTASPRFAFLVALPLLVAVLLPDFPWIALTLGLAIVACGSTAVVLEPRPLAWLLEWIFLASISTIFAVAGALAYRRSVLAEVRAERERSEVVARLAESDRRRDRAERLALAGRVAAGVAHEINNPLSFVKANVRFLRERLQEAGAGYDDATEAADETLLGVERIAQIVTDMRGLARESPPATGACEVGELVREAVRLGQGRQASVRVEAEVATDLPRAVASPRLLVQALVNLIVNGADAAVAGPAERRWVRVTARHAAGRVRIEVADGGPGLSPEARARLFEPFFTSKGAHGTGLGLALTLEHVQRCGGTLESAERPGPGALFVIGLAVAPPEAPEAVPTPLPAVTPAAVRSDAA